MRVPTLAMWQGKISAGKIYHDVATQMDWFPTFSAIAGAQLNKNIAIDGVDITQLLTSDVKREDSTFIFYDNATLEGYRSGDWKLKLPYKGSKGSPWKKAVAAHGLSLFNLKDDPAEAFNLVDQYPEKVAHLTKEMHQRVKDLGEFPPTITIRQKADESQVPKK
jgi:arylsulfatase A-like enzyme